METRRGVETRVWRRAKMEPFKWGCMGCGHGGLGWFCHKSLGSLPLAQLFSSFSFNFSVYLSILKSTMR